jgi:hypothetical protein
VILLSRLRDTPGSYTTQQVVRYKPDCPQWAMEIGGKFFFT